MENSNQWSWIIKEKVLGVNTGKPRSRAGFRDGLIQRFRTPLTFLWDSFSSALLRGPILSVGWILLAAKTGNFCPHIFIPYWLTLWAAASQSSNSESWGAFWLVQIRSHDHVAKGQNQQIGLVSSPASPSRNQALLVSGDELGLLAESEMGNQQMSTIA